MHTAATPGPDFDTEIAKFYPKQLEAVKILDSGRVKYFLFGGSMGPGKSYWLRWWCIRRLIVLARHFQVKNPVGMLACEDYPALKDRQLVKIGQEVPQWIGTLHQDHKNYGRCFILRQQWGGGVLVFRNLDDPSKYQSAEFAFIAVDELTKNDYETFNFLRTRMRWPGLDDDECLFVAASNPGGPGHGWVKQLWMDKLFGEEWIHPNDVRSKFEYLRATADDNPALPPSYWHMLETLPPNMRKAFREGDWNVFIGQAFPELSKVRHGIDPLPIPRGAPIYCTHDYGYGAPFSFGWWWVDGEGRVYRFHEWYGWSGHGNTGLHMADSEVAEELIKREKSMLPEWVRPEDIHRIAGPDLFAKKPNPGGQGQGPPTSEVYAEVGRKRHHQLIFRVGDPTRHLKIRQFHERLRVREDGLPMMLIYNTCEQFFRTMGNLIVDEHKIEDVCTKGEDHQYDEACHICMARPLAMPGERPNLSATDKRIDRLIRGERGSYDELATVEQSAELRRLESGRDSWEEDEDDDSASGTGLIPTV